MSLMSLKSFMSLSFLGSLLDLLPSPVVPCYMHNLMDSQGSRSALWQSVRSRISSWTGRRAQEVSIPPGEHPSPQDLERLFQGRLPREETGRLLAHLLRGCAVCQPFTAGLWQIGLEAPALEDGPAVTGGTAYDGAVGQVFARVCQAHRRLEGERHAALEALEELAAQPAERRSLLVRNSPRLCSWGLCERLLARSEAQLLTDPEDARGWAELAAAAAGRLSADRYPPTSLEDLRSWAWTALSEASCRLGDLNAAEQAFRTAAEHLARGTGDRIEKARLLDAEAALRCAQGRHREASRLRERSILLYRRTGQRHLAGRALIRQGHARVQAGDVDGGIALFQQGLGEIGAAGEQPELRRWWSSARRLQGLFRRSRAS